MRWAAVTPMYHDTLRLEGNREDQKLHAKCRSIYTDDALLDNLKLAAYFLISCLNLFASRCTSVPSGKRQVDLAGLTFFY